jgi:hypothetical protein
MPKDLPRRGVGVAVNSKGHVFVFSRGSTQGLACRGGASYRVRRQRPFRARIGKNLYAWSFAHTVRVDRDDNIWCTDKGSDLVVKFSPGQGADGAPRQTGGERRDTAPLTPAAASRRRQALPPVTDVTWDPAGNIFISDGYINSRVAKVDRTATGDVMGTRGDKPGESTPHSIAADAQGNVYVADRFNRRIRFDGTAVPARDHDRRAVRQTTKPVIGNPGPERDPGTFSPGAPGRSASRLGRTRCSTA